MNQPYITRIIDTTLEADNIKTITFNYAEKVSPGQFFMIWIPGIDEIPMSVSRINKTTKAITFRKVGEATTSLFQLKKGDLIGIRGPYGNAFSPIGNHILFVAGGTGLAMLLPAIEEAHSKGSSITVVIGVKTKSELFFTNRLKKLGVSFHICTDDGSEGFQGFASEYAEKFIKKQTFSSILTCGPELMMKRLLDIAGDIPFQVSLERYMKCAIGLCGQCCIGEGLRVCKEGPIFDGKTLKAAKDFGVFRRDSAGGIVPF